jgi:Bacterial SH3 domain
MANASVRLPKVSAFELPDSIPPLSTPSSAPELEAALMSGLGTQAEAFAEGGAVQPGEPAGASRLTRPSEADKSKWDSLDPQVVARRLVQQLARAPAAKPQVPSRDVIRVNAPGRTLSRIDPNAAATVVGRTDFVAASAAGRMDPRTPSAAGRTELGATSAVGRTDLGVGSATGRTDPPRAPAAVGRTDLSAASGVGRMDPRSASLTRRPSPISAPTFAARGPAAPRLTSVRRDPVETPPTTKEARGRDPASGSDKISAAEQRRVTEAVESVLRSWSLGDEQSAQPATPRPERQAPPRNAIAVAALLLIGAGAGAWFALQWASPRDDALVAAPAAGAAVASVQSTGAAPARSATQAPAGAVKPVAAAQTASVTAGGAVSGATPSPASNGSAATLKPSIVPGSSPSWLVEDDPATFASSDDRQAAPRANAAPPPSWYVEDDPGALQTAKAAPADGGRSASAPAPVAAAVSGAAAAKRMVVTADVEVRAGPDTKFDSMGILPAGTVVPVGDCTVWCPVTVNGKSGWVFYTFLADPSAAATATR